MRTVLVLAAGATLVAVLLLRNRTDTPAPQLPIRTVSTEESAAIRETTLADPGPANEPEPSPRRVEPERRGRLAVAGRILRATPGGPVESARPAANVAFELEYFLEGAGKPFEGELKTDTEGRFALDLENADESAGSIRIRVRAEGYQTVDPSFFFDAGTTELTDVVVIQYEFADLFGRVVDPEGRPVEGVRFRVKDAGTPREAITDAAGGFRIPSVWSPLEPDVFKEGWIVLDIPTFRKDDVGRWHEVDVLVGPTATLQLRLVDGAGDGVAERRVQGGIGPIDEFGASDSGWAPFEPPTSVAETDASGRATLAGLAAGRRLRIKVDGREFEYRDAQWQLRESPDGAVPLILEPGEVRDAEIRYGRPVQLRGHVFEPDGTPSPRAYVSVRALDVIDRGRPDVMGVVRTDEDGAFELSATPEETSRRVFLLARGSIGEIVSKSMFGGTLPPDPLHACWQVIELPDSGAPVGDLVLRLEVMESIAGRVVGPEGEGTTAKLRLLPHDPSPLLDRLSTGARLSRDAAVDGTFEFKGVPSGLYDLEARASEHATTIVRGVAAGDRAVEVQVTGEPEATVTLEVECAVELKQVILLRARLDPLDDELIAPPLAESLTVDEPFGWPKDALGLWYGAQTYSGDLGRTMFSSSPIEGRTKTYSLDTGLYWFGAKAATPDGMCFPIGTGLVRVGEGEHTIRFVLEEAGSIEGRVSGEESIVELCVGVAVPGSALIPLDVGREAMAPWAELSAAGGFRLGIVPARSLELRVGTAQELEAGDARARRSLVVEPGETTRVELDL